MQKCAVIVFCSSVVLFHTQRVIAAEMCSDCLLLSPLLCLHLEIVEVLECSNDSKSYVNSGPATGQVSHVRQMKG